MHSSNANTVDHRGCQSWSRRGGRTCKGNWSGFNIAAMVVGFVFFWPVGLVVLFWIMSGRQARDLPGAVREQWDRLFSNGKPDIFGNDNVVFSDYQQTQYDRISEIKEEIKSRARRFGEFRMDIKRRKDQDEFNRFMADGPKPNADEQKDG